MRCSLAFFVAGTIASQLGSPVARSPSLVKRDLPTITNALAGILSAVNVLYADVQAFTGTGAQINDLTFHTGDVITTITKATQTVAGTSDLDLNDAVALTPQIQNLSAATYATVATIIMKKQVFVHAGIGTITLQTFKVQLDETNTFSATVLSKLPEAVQGIGANLSAPVVQALNAGITAFADQANPTGSKSAGILSASPAFTGLAAIFCSVVVAAFAIV